MLRPDATARVVVINESPDLQWVLEGGRVLRRVLRMRSLTSEN